MSEEEKKAVFYLKDLENDKEHLIIEQRQAITTILNLIEKQQKELNKEKEKNDELKEQLCDIHNNFCKFNWKESNGVQVYNQLKELYNSIYRTKKENRYDTHL